MQMLSYKYSYNIFKSYFDKNKLIYFFLNVDQHNNITSAIYISFV